MRKYILYASLLILIGACKAEKNKQSLFTLLPYEHTGIDFRNDVEYTPEFNTYTYRNFYNGGGVGIGDINNDGLPDIFFCGNLKDNKLYLNLGDFHFEDITETAGLASANVWSTGVSFADINGDGWLDIYVCKSGKPGGDNRHNELFINNGDLSFSEQAKAYGIADEGLSAHAAFFDFDKDGDLDCYLLNNSFRPVERFNIQPGLRELRDSLGANKLYRNDSGRFTDISEAAGIYGSYIGFGLGVTIGDINRDGWQDMYISNDFFERDYLYINQKDGTFREDLLNQIRETSLSSMGADMADINNDGYPEIFVTEMLPESDARYKTKMTFEDWDSYQLRVSNGYHHQFARNTLQLNNGNNTFSEIGRLANVHATDWSWSALILDLDNDGFKDIYIANGIYKDLLDQDYIDFYSNDPAILKSIKNRERDAILKLIDIIPTERIGNYAYKNNKDLTFSNKSEEWGLDIPSSSNGSSFGDLDNDGDLDLVVNNSNMPAFVFRNEANTLTENNYLRIVLKGPQSNTFALGAQVTIKHKQEEFFQELAPMRGFQSSVEYPLHFGLGTITSVEQIEVLWPDNRISELRNIASNQELSIDHQNAQIQSDSLPTEKKHAPLLMEVNKSGGLDYTHRENNFVDFYRDRMLFSMVSADGPKMCKGDVNGDGLDDFFIGGASGQAGTLFIQANEGRFIKSNETLFEKDKVSEDVGAIFFDADNDNDLDLYVTSGGNEFHIKSNVLYDRLYINAGNGLYTKSIQKLPTQKLESTSCVRAADFDRDGDQDLFVGVRLKPGVYGVPVKGYLLENDGAGNFTNVAEKLAPELNGIGMITDALWTDFDQDKDLDLFIVGEWMPLTIMENNNGHFKKISPQAGLDQSNGFWNCIKTGDMDNDGDPDYIMGNHGLNTRFKASKKRPLSMLVNNFDNNTTVSQIICGYNGDKAYPFVRRNDLLKQMPGLENKYPLHANYKEQSIEDIFTEQQIRTSAKSFIYNTQTSIAWNNGNGTFDLEALPLDAQFTPVYSILVEDVDLDGNLDLLIGGNFYRSKPEMGIYDGTYGLILKGNGLGGFSPLKAERSGFLVKGEIRDFLGIKVNDSDLILVARNNDSLLTFSKHERK